MFKTIIIFVLISLSVESPLDKESSEDGLEVSIMDPKTNQTKSVKIGLVASKKPSVKVMADKHSYDYISLQFFYNHTDNVIIKSNAFSELDQWNKIYLLFWDSNFRIEKNAFKISNKTKEYMEIDFTNSEMNQIQDGAFSGIQSKSVHFNPDNTGFGTDYLPEPVFKPFLDANQEYKIFFEPSFKHGTFNCENCKNQWLIRDKKQSQVCNLRCTQDYHKSLFDEDIQTKLNKTCSK